ncbi:MAG: DUF945 domain-containing protein [Oscillospiraceae bacterium]|nr:DUF945 domain-containing protein [Oscillospiraceae bacterium]
MRAAPAFQLALDGLRDSYEDQRGIYIYSPETDSLVTLEYWLRNADLSRPFYIGGTIDYLCFSNTHDGSGAIRVCMTPIRVVCNNTLNLALDNAKRSWSVRHTGDIRRKTHEAQACLYLAHNYIQSLAERADRMANTTVTREQLNQILDELFPVDENSSEREKRGVEKLKTEYMTCYFAPDILKFRGTAWGAVNAMSDMISHNAPRRKTENYRENNWGRIMDGHILLDKMAALLPVR